MIQISVIIPCRNEEFFIEKCLNSILNSDYQKELLEILVCDGKSEDNTAELVKKITESNSYVKLLVNEKKTTPNALNLGIKNAKGKIIMILGAHAEISEDYISKCLTALNSDDKIGCVGGVLENISSGSGIAISLAMSSLFGVGNAFFRTGNKDGYVDTVAFGVYKKEVFDKIGYFDEELTRNQDDEFNYRVTNAGYKIFLSSDIKAKYYVRSSFMKLFKQYFQYGYWKVYVNKKHQTLTSIRQIIPLLFVLFCISGLFIPLMPTYYLLFYLIIVTCYLLLAIISAILKTINPIIILQMVFSFFILHFSYGFGYLEGIVNFYFLNRKPGAQKTSSSR